MKIPRILWDVSLNIGPFRYTYQDWANGVIETAQLEDLLNDPENLLSQEEFEKILKTQEQATVSKIVTTQNTLCYEFWSNYYSSYTKEQLLRDEIDYVKRLIEDCKTNKPEIYRKGLLGKMDSKKLSYKETAKFIEDYKVKRIYSMPFVPQELDSPSEVVIYIKYKEWLCLIENGNKNLLKSFMDHNNKIMKDFTSDNESLSDAKGPTWHQIFKEPKQADKILILLSEFLTDTGQWNTANACRHLQGLYLELRQKGYMKRGLTAKQVANALNSQFGTDYVFDNFQESQLSKAEDYKDNFRYIPAYQPPK